MRSLIHIIPSILLILLACATPTPPDWPPPQDATPPSAPVADDVRPAVAPGGLIGVRLSWLPSPEPDVRGYRVFRLRTAWDNEMVPIGAVEGSGMFYDLDIEMPAMPPQNADYDEYEYRYLVHAVDHNWNQGQPSDTLTCTLIEPPILQEPRGSISEATPTFRWHVGYEHGFSYVLGVLSEEGGLVWQYAPDELYFDPTDFEVLFDTDGTASIAALDVGVSYTWWVEVKAVGYAHWGSIAVAEVRVGE